LIVISAGTEKGGGALAREKLRGEKIENNSANPA
jgi:hypothetical protein